jgi:mycothiol conjugate amidase Mca
MIPAYHSARRTLLAVHAHPDDECIFGGGTLARYAAEGVQVVLVTCTNGDKGRLRGDWNNRPISASEVASLRQAELAAAARILGISHLHTLGYHDSGRSGAVDDPMAFTRADATQVVGRLVRLMRHYRPAVVVTYDEQGAYGHPDHIMAHRATMAAYMAAADEQAWPGAGAPWTLRKLYYCSSHRQSDLDGLWSELARQGSPRVFGDLSPDRPPSWGVADDWATTHIDVRAFVRRKQDALRAHRTQIRPDASLINLPLDLARLYLGWECFRLAAGPVRSITVETDLFADVEVPEAALAG